MILDTILQGDCLEILKTLPDECVDCVVTSPPYWGLRDYGTAKWDGGDEKCDHEADILSERETGQSGATGRGSETTTILTSIKLGNCNNCGAKRIDAQLGLEKTPEEYVAKMVLVFREVRRVLKKEGVMFLNLGDSYAGSWGATSHSIKGKAKRTGSNVRPPTSFVSSAKRGAPYGISGKERASYQGGDCLCENLCDECLAALRHSPRTFRERVSTLPPLSFESNLGRKELSSDHSPTSDSSLPVDHSEVATLKTRPSFRRDRAPVSVSRQSKRHESSPQRQEESRQSDSPSVSQDVASEKSDDASLSVCRKVCICGKVLPISSSVCHISGSGKVHNVYPYPYSTTEYLKPKDLVGIPWRVAFALQADGWYLRQDIIWAKPNPMPESVTDRCTKSHEYIFLMAKSGQYYYDAEAVKEKGVMQSSGSEQRDTIETHGLGGGNSGINEAKARMKKELAENGYVMRNKRSVWTVTTKPFSGAHFATFPEDLIAPMVKAGCPPGGVCLDPFMGAGTTALVAQKLNRHYIGIELNPAYIKMAEKRLKQPVML